MLRSIFAFSFVGFFITLCSVASYWLLAGPGHLDANLSLLIVYIIFTIWGHFLHGAFSFQDVTGGRSVRHSLVRFAFVSLLGFSLNQAFVFLFIKHWDLAEWTATIPMILVTPPIVFVLGRYWVFRRDLAID